VEVAVILGVDPGLANCGWALVATGGVLLDRGAIATTRGRSTGDAQRRVELVGRVLYQLVGRADLVVVEWPTGGFGSNALAATSTAAIAGLVAGLSWSAGTKIRAPAPVTWRTKLGAKRGKDAELHAELAARYAAQLAGLKKGEMPHVLDAIGLALYGELATSARRPHPDPPSPARPLRPGQNDPFLASHAKWRPVPDPTTGGTDR